MKNLKKVLALALVFAMTLTLFAGAAFIDQDTIGVDYLDDVNMLVELGVLKGYADNSFKPENNVTRAEFAKMAYTLKYGYDDQGQLFVGQKSAFTDVEGVSSIAWAKGYINYCANQKVISGVGANKFNPNGNVTVAEAAKMLLVILGCDPQTEGLVGANWQGNTVAKAIELGVFDGWVGDPTAPASRQLVAKLMRNTIFAPIYIYSPITGAGSQKDILDPKEDNVTLGEKTMGLEHETGIVVANELYAIKTNGEGEVIGDIKPTDDEDKSVIAYENAAGKWVTLTINAGLPADMLGNLVDVYYAYDKETKQYEVLGNVLVSAKTVIYDVAASDIDIMPNGESRKTGSVKPEIVFTTEDGEYTIAAPAGTGRVDQAKNNYSGLAFVKENMFYNITSSAKGDLIGKYELIDAEDFYDEEEEAYDEAKLKKVDIIANMGEDVATSYRLISIDGGASISYIFSNPNVSFGQVTAYSEAKGTISAKGALGTNNDLDDIVVYDGLKRGDYVVAKAENGKAVLYPTETVTGSVTKWSNNTAVINDVTYSGAKTFFDNAAIKSSTTLAQFFGSNEGRKYTRGATFFAYGNLLMGFDTDVAVSTDASTYAVVLKSSFDERTGDSVVKLGLANGSEVSYTVAAYTDLNGNTEEADEEDISGYFEDNNLFGAIVSYNELSGKVEVILEKAFDGAAAIGDDDAAVSYKIKGEAIYKVGEENKKVYANENSSVFMLYTTSSESRTVKFKVYNMMDINETQTAAVPSFMDNGNKKMISGAAVMADNEDEVLMAVITAGDKGTPSFDSRTDNVGYIVDSEVIFAGASKKALKVSLISLKDKAVISGEFADAKGLTSKDVGYILEADNDPYAIGSIANYAFDGEKFTAVDVDDLGTIKHQKEAWADGESGYYRVTIAGLTKTRISYYPYGSIAKDNGDGVIDDSALTTKAIDEYRFESVAIVDGEADGEEVDVISKYDEVGATDYNAIVRISNTGVVDKIFSLYGMIG